MTQTSRLTGAVDVQIDRFLTRRLPILTSIGPELLPFDRYSRDLLSGGKRTRPRLSYWAWRAALDSTKNQSIDLQGREFERLAQLGASLELFQAAALVHDDIIDSSDLRRGMPAAHRKFEQLHLDDALIGDAAHYGVSSAILLGDLLLGWSDELLDEAISDSPHREAVRQVYTQMRTEVTLGQYLDIYEEHAWPDVAESEAIERALRVVTYKSAKYSAEAPLALGARLGGASDELVSGLTAFGLPLGRAFQLRDDVLGVFGDSSVTGKPSGDDLVEGKRTVLIALARQNLSGGALASFDARLGDPELDQESIAALQEVIQFTGALTECERLIAAYTAEARAALEACSLSPELNAELMALAVALTQRAK